MRSFREKIGPIIATLVVAAVFAVVGLHYTPGVDTAHAQIKIIAADSPIGGNGGDSTSVTLANSGADTTEWLDLYAYKWPSNMLAATPLVKLVLTSNAVSGDTIGCVVQYSQDKSAIFAKTKAYFIGASPQQLTVLSYDTSANEPAAGFHYLRAITSDEDVSRSTAFTGLKLTYLISPLAQ